MKFTPSLNLALLLGAPLVLSIGLCAQTNRSSVLIDTTSGAGLGLDNADIATSGDLSVVIYSDNLIPSHVYASTSDAAGLTWSTPVQVDSDTTGELKTTGFQNKTHNVFIVGDSIYTVWLDARAGSGDTDVYFARSTDRGVTWSEQRIDKGLSGGFAFDAEDYTFAVSGDVAGDHIYIGMLVDNGGVDEIYLAASHDGGVNFNATVSPSTANGLFDVDGLSICADGLTVHTAWTDVRAGTSTLDDLWYRRSTDGGVTFDAEIQLDESGPLSGDISLSPAIDCLGNRVAVAWEEELIDSANEEIHAIVSIDSGLTFLDDLLVSDFDPTAVDADGVSVVLCGANAVVGWDDNRDVAGDASYVALSTNDGGTWEIPVQVSTAGGVGFPRFGTNGTTTVVVSSEGNSPNVLETSYSLDCGLNWTAFVTGSDTGGDTDNTRVVYNSSTDNVLLQWLSDEAGANNAYVGGYSLCDTGALTFRNAGTNPATYTATVPTLGQIFTATVDMTSTGHNLAILVGFATPLTFTLGGGQTVLVNLADPQGELLGLSALAGPVANFSLVVPNNPAFCGLSVSTQAVHIGGAPFVMTNAQDLVLTGI